MEDNIVTILPFILAPVIVSLGFPCSSVSKESACSAGDPGFDPWVGKIPWRRKWQPNPVSLPGRSHGQKSLAGCTVCGVTKSQARLSD